MRAKERKPLPWCHLSSPALPGPLVRANGLTRAALLRPAHQRAFLRRTRERRSAAAAQGAFSQWPAVSTSAGPPTLLGQSRYGIARDYTMPEAPLCGGRIRGYCPAAARMRPLGSYTPVQRGSILVCRHIRHVRHSGPGKAEIVSISSIVRSLAPDDGFEEVDFASVTSVIQWIGATDLSGTLLFEAIQMVRRPLRYERPIRLTA